MSAGKIITRDWWGPGIKKRPVKKWAFGFSVQHNGKQVRRFKSEWKTAEDAAKGLAAFQLGLAPKTEPARSSCPEFTLGQAAGRYLEMKARKKSIREDRRILEVLKREFGADTALSDLTASRISAYKARRLAAVSRQSGIGLSTASVNRPLALLRHLLRLAHEEWELLPTVPRIRLEKEPQGRIRWLEPDEEQRLLEACLASPSPWVYPITTIALESGCRRGELLGLTWDRVDLSRGVIRLEVTKSGRRREIPMRQVVYDILAGLPGSRDGRVWPVRTIRKAFEQAVVAAKLDDFHFHDTRHHFASWFVMQGGALPALQQLLGHKTLAMTMRYAHLNEKHLRAEVAKTERSGQDQHMISTKLVESPATVA
jgi:integrase